MAGSASRFSSSPYSASSADKRSVVMGFPQIRTRRPPPCVRERASAGQLLGVLLLLDLGVLGLELGHPAGRVEDALLARVERVADVARLGVDSPALGGAAGLEGVATGTR